MRLTCPDTATSHTFQNSQPSRNTTPAPTQAEPPAPTQADPPEPARRGRSRRTAPRFKGFDDDDDDAPVNLRSIPEAPAVNQTTAPEPESQGLFVSQDQRMDIDHSEAQQRTTETRSSRKRATPPVQYDEKEEAEEFMDQLAPGAAALKKRRVAEQTARRRRGESTPPPALSVIDSPVPESPPPKKVKKEVDLLEIARHQREKAEELARKEREALQEVMNGMDIEAIRNLAIIEDIEVLRQPPPVRAIQADESDRWDDRWNGRKNFKKFRRHGADGGRAINFNRVIVPLEEVKKKDFGIGDDYWLENDNALRKKKTKTQDTPPASQGQSRSRPANAASTRAAEILAAESEGEDLVGDAPEPPPSSDVEILDEEPVPPPTRSQWSQRQASVSRTQPAASNKRPAATSLTKPAPAKKARQAAGAKRKEESDDSDDELKFRFRR